MTFPAPSSWPRIPEQAVERLSDQEKLFLLSQHEKGIAVTAAELADVIANCKARPDFAKMYRMLRRDRRKTLQNMAILKQHHSLSEEFRTASMQSYRLIIDYKLSKMADHFHMKWGESVESWSGPEGGFLDRNGWLDAGGGLLVTVLVVVAAVLLLRQCF